MKRNIESTEVMEAFEDSRPYVLLRSKKLPARRHIVEQVLPIYSYAQIDQIYNKYLKNSDVVALDYEANGLNVYSPVFKAVGVGLASSKGRFYFVNFDEDTWQYLHRKLSQLKNLIAHNIMYDGAVMYKYAGVLNCWKYDTYGLYRQFATEGFYGQSWSLKTAQIDLLEWEDTNEVELENWLISNAYSKQAIKRKEGESREDYIIRYNQWLHSRNPDQLKKIRPNKAFIYKVPLDILSKYCLLDAESTYLLHTGIFQPLFAHFPTVSKWHTTTFMNLIQVHIYQYMLGMKIDREYLINYQIILADKIEKAYQELRKHDKFGKLILERESEILAKLKAKEPEKHLKKPKLAAEPAKLTKSGKESKSWVNWNERRIMIETMEPDVSKSWIAWNEKYTQALDVTNPNNKYRINIASKATMCSLLYDSGLIKYEVTKEHVGGDQFHAPVYGEITIFTEDGRRVPIKMTQSGGLPAGKDAFTQMGDLGKLLLKYSKLTKEMSFVEAYLELSEEDGRIHPNFKVPGTFTGRLAGTNPNLQQLMKSYDFLRCMIADDDKMWISVDHSSLEQVVLAGFSKDTSLLSLYGPAAKVNDVYLFVGAQLPIIGPKIRATGYDPFNPTQEAIDIAKKECKKERSIAKVIVLSSSYGAGANKIWQTLNINGVVLKLEQVKQIHATYWEIFNEVKGYVSWLEENWRLNCGYILNELDFPICVADNKIKDILNRNCQTSGHMIHMMWLEIVMKLFEKYGIEWEPVIADWHDQSIFQINPKDAEQVKHITLVEAYKELNTKLQMIVDFKGDATFATNMAEAKED